MSTTFCDDCIQRSSRSLQHLEEDRQVQVGAINQEHEAEFTFQHAFVSEIFGKDSLVVPTDGVLKMLCRMNREQMLRFRTRQHVEITVPFKNAEAEHSQEPPEADVALPNPTACEVKLRQDHHEEPRSLMERQFCRRELKTTRGRKPRTRSRVRSSHTHANHTDEFYTKEARTREHRPEVQLGGSRAASGPGRPRSLY
jgi:hypothetical protein